MNGLEKNLGRGLDFGENANFDTIEATGRGHYKRGSQIRVNIASRERMSLEATMHMVLISIV